MKKEYAILNVPYNHDFENDMEDHRIFRADNVEAVYNELIRIDADDENNSIEEYRVDEDGEFYDGSDYDTVDNFKKRFGTWYAVLADAEDGDLGYGSYDRAEAFRMLREAEYLDGRIAVVEMGTDPIVTRILFTWDE